MNKNETDNVKLFCPITGLQLFTQDGWRERKIGDNFTANFYIIGRSVLYSGPSGTADIGSTKSVLRLSGQVAEKVAGGTKPYIQIEDYTSFDNATIEARKYFIDQMILRDRIRVLIFCNLSPMMNLFVKIGKRFNTTGKSVYAVRDYKEAIEKALQLCRHHNLDTGPYVFGKQTAYSDNGLSLIPGELASNNSWDIETDDFTNRTILIDQSILHSVSSGSFREAHVPMVNNLRKNFRDMFPSNKSFEYFVVDVSNVKKVSRKARQSYMKSFKDWFKQFPIRIYIIYGANKFINVIVRLARPFMPFKIEIARDIEHAFRIIWEDKRLISGEKKEIPAAKTDPIQNYIEDLLAYIGGIDWGKAGVDNISETEDQNHPFSIVFQAINLIKDELDDLFRTRDQFEAELVESEKKYRELFEKGSDLLCFHDLDGNLIESNIAFKKEYGMDGELPESLNLSEFITKRYRNEFKDYLHRIKIKGYDKGLLNVITVTGQEAILEYDNVLVKDKDGKPIGVKGSARNITDRIVAQRERKKLQEQLIQKHKMEAIGILAGGIAHDFNNILSIVLGNTELALDDIPDQHPAHSNLEVIKNAVLRAKEIVRQLLNFSRKTEQELKPIKIRDVIKDSLKLLRSTITTTIDIRTNIQVTNETILADPTQISQVMINLCTNSSQEMEQTGGILDINVEKIFLEKEPAGINSSLNSGNYIKITVSDTGPGIAPEVIDQIFDPYFTTKEFGSGSGMGLAVVHGIVKNHSGGISVDSEIGKGTTFTVFFPIVAEEPEIKTETTNELPFGTERILFVDDEELIIEMTERMLTRLGYKVETKMSPTEAIELFQSKSDQFDLVITDMTMPQMTGDKLLEKLRVIRADIPVIICTGHSSLIDEEKAKDIGVASYIMKPFVMKDIANMIRSVLDEAKN